jgi:ribose/xylose/arabinose/galactoside ABC-type transport system permease subunit
MSAPSRPTTSSIGLSSARLWVLRNAPAILFVAVFLIFSLLAPRFLSVRAFENILRQASYIGIVAIGMTFVLLTGGIDISAGSVMYLSATVAGVLVLGNDLPVWLAVVAVILVGLVCGSLNALVITRFGVAPFVVTLGSLAVFRGLGLTISQSKGVNFPEAITGIGSARVFGLPLPVLIFLGVALLAHFVLTQTPFGREVYALGNDPQGASRAGIRTRRVLFVIYAICGVCAALGGLISTAQLGIVNAGFGQGDEFDAIAAAVLGGASLFGGRGTVLPGTILGAVLVQMIAAGLIFTRVDIYAQPLVTAGIFFLAVLIDSQRTALLTRLQRRRIRPETASQPSSITPTGGR